MPTTTTTSNHFSPQTRLLGTSRSVITTTHSLSQLLLSNPHTHTKIVFDGEILTDVPHDDENKSVVRETQTNWERTTRENQPAVNQHVDQDGGVSK